MPRYRSFTAGRNWRRSFVLLLLLALLIGTGSAGGAAAQQPSHAAPPQLLPEHWSRQPVLAVPPVRGEAPTIDGYVKYKEWILAASTRAFLDVEVGGLPAHPVRHRRHRLDRLGYGNEAAALVAAGYPTRIEYRIAIRHHGLKSFNAVYLDGHAGAVADPDFPNLIAGSPNYWNGFSVAGKPPWPQFFATQ